MQRTGYDLLYNDIKNISKIYKKLSRLEEIDLIKKYQASGDEKHRNAIVNSNLKIIVGETKKFHSRSSIESSLFLDLIGVAFQEAIECIDRYDLSKGDGTVCSFIRNSVNMALKNWSKTNIEKGKFLLLHKPSNRYAEHRLEDEAAIQFSHKNGRFPVSGESIKLKGGNTISYMRKNKVSISLGWDSMSWDSALDSTYENNNPYSSDKHRFTYNTIDVKENTIEYEEDNNKLKIIGEYVKTLDNRKREIYDYLYCSDMKKKDALLNLSPTTDSEIKKAESTGSNHFIIKMNNGEIEINLISYIKNEKNNSLHYIADDISFDYHSNNEGVYNIHLTEGEVNINDIIISKKERYAIYKNNNEVNYHQKLTQGICLNPNQLKKHIDKLILDIRLNKNLMTQIYE